MNSDMLYFEPLTFEDVWAILPATKSRRRSSRGDCAFGGDTVNLALPLQGRPGVNIIGTSPESIDLAEDRSTSTSYSKN